MMKKRNCPRKNISDRIIPIILRKSSHARIIVRSYTEVDRVFPLIPFREYEGHIGLAQCARLISSGRYRNDISECAKDCLIKAQE